MRDLVEEASDELKRVDHLVFVSLKYTRTVDVLLNAASRMIDAYEVMFVALLTKAKEDRKIGDIPDTPIEKGEVLKDLYSHNAQIKNNVDLFFLLRKIKRSKSYEKDEEYRRHVSLRTVIDGREEVLNIDIITKYYAFQKEFFQKVKDILNIYKTA